MKLSGRVRYSLCRRGVAGRGIFVVTPVPAAMPSMRLTGPVGIPPARCRPLLQCIQTVEPRTVWRACPLAYLKPKVGQANFTKLAKAQRPASHGGREFRNFGGYKPMAVPLCALVVPCQGSLMACINFPENGSCLSIGSPRRLPSVTCASLVHPKMCARSPPSAHYVPRNRRSHWEISAAFSASFPGLCTKVVQYFEGRGGVSV